MDQVPDVDAELAEAWLELQETAPPGWAVLDMWRCGCCSDLDFHAIVQPPEVASDSRTERRGASRARRRGGRRG